MAFIFLGTGAGNGGPVFYCGCKVCREAAADPGCRRTRCAVAVTGEKNILIDAPPEISAQLLREKIDAIDHLFLTHAHHDHTAGLGDLAIYIQFFRNALLPAFMSSETLDELETCYPSVSDWLDVKVISPGQTIEVGDVNVTAVEASHAPGTMGYIISDGSCCTAYIPDTGPLLAETLKKLKGIERLVLDATVGIS